MIYSYMITVKLLSGESWAGDTIVQDIYMRANMPDLGVFLRTLDASNTVQGITVFKTLTIPDLTKIVKMTREDLHIQNNEMLKVS